jgi:hypothetical protein
MTSYVTAYCYTNRGENHIMTVASDDSGFDALVDAITSQGLGSLQGQTITKVMCWVDNYVTQGNGVIVVDPQNTPQSSIPVSRIEVGMPQWQAVNIGPIDLNWVAKVTTSASLA